jgi:hypothetical protein
MKEKRNLVENKRIIYGHEGSQAVSVRPSGKEGKTFGYEDRGEK